MAAIDPKPSKRRWDNHPRVVRKKPQPVALTDDPLLYRDEKAYRLALWRDFVRFVRDAGAWVVTTPAQGNVRCQVPADSPLLERLAQLPRYPVVKLPSVSHRLALGRFVPVREIQVTLWRGS
jgi:hypothetical protein